MHAEDQVVLNLKTASLQGGCGGEGCANASALTQCRCRSHARNNGTPFVPRGMSSLVS